VHSAIPLMWVARTQLYDVSAEYANSCLLFHEAPARLLRTLYSLRLVDWVNQSQSGTVPGATVSAMLLLNMYEMVFVHSPDIG